jgi:MSHA pilin protein MshD
MCNRRQRGFSLIEVIVFIVVLGIGIAAVAVIYNQITVASVDPLVRKQTVAIANSLMEEIQLRPFTYCDPDDAAVFTAANPAGCGVQEGIGAEGGETRYGAPRYDNVSDYHGFSMPGSIQDFSNATINGLAGYSAQVSIANGGTDFPAAVPAAEALRITVTVTGPANVRVVLQGYRLRYAPNSP